MAQMQVMKSMKWCTNCKYWTGERVKDEATGKFVVDNTKTAPCDNPMGYYQVQCNFNTTCNQFDAVE